MTRNLLFIHHSCGGQLLAEPGAQSGGERDSGSYCIYDSHPNGGGLREMLRAAGFTVNEENIQRALGRNPILVTALNPVIGYELGAATAKKAYAEGRPIREVHAGGVDLIDDDDAAQGPVIGRVPHPLGE